MHARRRVRPGSVRPVERAALGRVLWACAARAQRPVARTVAHAPAACDEHTAQEAAERTGDPATRADGPLARLTPALRTAVDRLLVEQPDPAHRTVLLAAVAAGHDVPTLERLADQLRAVPADGLPVLLDPGHHVLRQASGTTCGSACLVTARAIVDPVYALWLLQGVDTRTGHTSAADLAGRFAAAEQMVHRRTTAAVLHGRWQVPWPRALGTPPWGVAAELTRIWTPPGDAIGPRFRTRLVDPDDEASRHEAVDALAAAVGGGRTAALFVGDGWTPRHVVLAVGADGSGLAVYEPGGGQVVTVPRADLVAGRAVLGGWDRLWAVVVPG